MIEMMNRFTVCCLLLTAPLFGWSQARDSITLEECYKLAVECSSLGERQDLSQNIAISEIKEIGSVYIPSASLNGVVSYQSDVVHVPMPSIEPPRKEMYRATIDIEQLIYDGGMSARGKEIISSSLKAEELKLDIEKLSLKDRVANLYLSIELLKRNREIILLQIDIINNSLEKLRNLEKNGVATKENVIKLETELLGQKQNMIETESNRTKIVEMLSILIQLPLGVDVEYILPSCELQISGISKRPEFTLFEAQTEIIDGRIKLSSRDNMPKISAFATGGNGLPGLNMLSHDPQWYYVVGLKFSVPLTNWKSTKHTQQKYVSQQSIIQAQRGDFERNNEIAINSSIREIAKFRELISSDKEIIAKKHELLKIEEQKLENGVSTSNDYIVELNGYESALLSQNLNEIKLIEAIINYKSNIGEN